MNSSWKIATVSGIPIKLHISMVLLPIFFFDLLVDHPIIGLILLVALFGSVLAHELGHTFVAMKYGIKAKNITLSPFGGIAMLSSMPSKPSQEIAIAIAGPLVSLALAGGLYILLPVAVALGGTSASSPPVIAVIAYHTMRINFILGLFNLIPALPMDGGRVLRGVLSLKHGPLVGTEWAVRVSSILAVGGFLYGLFHFNWGLVFIAVFVYLTSKSELLHARMKNAVQNGQMPFGGARGPGPFGRVWVHRSGPTPAQPNDDSAQYWRGKPVDNGWKPPQNVSQSPGKPEVIQGGRVEVISRKDPKS